MECQYCKKIFTTKSGLNKPQRTAKYCLAIRNVTPPGDFKCEVCNKAFTLEDTYKKHIIECKKNQDISKLPNLLNEKDSEIKRLEKENQQLKDERDSEIKRLEKENQSVEFEINYLKDEKESEILSIEYEIKQIKDERDSEIQSLEHEIKQIKDETKSKQDLFNMRIMKHIVEENAEKFNVHMVNLNSLIEEKESELENLRNEKQQRKKENKEDKEKDSELKLLEYENQQRKDELASKTEELTSQVPQLAKQKEPVLLVYIQKLVCVLKEKESKLERLKNQNLQLEEEDYSVLKMYIIQNQQCKKERDSEIKELNNLIQKLRVQVVERDSHIKWFNGFLAEAVDRFDFNNDSYNYIIL